MTNSSDSSTPLPKLLIIHGLNNNLRSMGPLREAFVQRGFNCELVSLPGHGNDRWRSRSFEQAMEIFSENMSRVATGDYTVVAFSTGALYLQLWLREQKSTPPKSQILLAPALQVRRDAVISRLIRLLPAKLLIPSRSPRELRRYPGLYVWEYQVLYAAIRRFQTEVNYLIPTLILVDPKDDLVDAGALRSLTQSELVIQFPRPYLWKLGHHHIFFHPDYFQGNDWDRLLAQMVRFLSAGA